MSVMRAVKALLVAQTVSLTPPIAFSKLLFWVSPSLASERKDCHELRPAYTSETEF